MRKIALLGATGSIGRQALEIVEAHPELELVAAASGSQDDRRARAADAGRRRPHRAARARRAGRRPQRGRRLRRPARRRSGRSSAASTSRSRTRRASSPPASSRSPRSSAGAGRCSRSTASTRRSTSASRAAAPESVDSLVLTASGGPFRGRTRDELEDVTPAEALAHPTWSMGPKITVDSATLANKGLELIEAHFLFGLPYDRIEVVVHPTSVVHALVRFRDGAALAHLGYPDMRVPISYALTYPERAATPVPALDLAAGLTLEFSRAGPRDVPAARARARGGRARRHLPVRLQRRQRGRRRRVPRRAAAVPRDRRRRRRRARRGRRRARRATSTTSSRPTREARRLAGAASHERRDRDPRPRVPGPRPRGSATSSPPASWGCARAASTSASRRRSSR